MSPSTTRRGPRGPTPLYRARPRRGNDLSSSHVSSQGNHDLEGSCSGLGPTGPIALIRPNPNGLAEDHADQRDTVVPDVLHESTCSTSNCPARHPAVQLDSTSSTPTRADSIHCTPNETPKRPRLFPPALHAEHPGRGPRAGSHYACRTWQFLHLAKPAWPNEGTLAQRWGL